MSNFNVQNDEWLEIAFENRNKTYGAYQLRKESDATTIKAMLITFGALALGIGLFSFTTPEPKPEDVISCRANNNYYHEKVNLKSKIFI